MSDLRSLPERPALRRLRDEAKARKRAGEFATLADAQFALAREYGFASWPRLKIHVESRLLDLTERAAALVRSACSSDLRTARTLLDADPDLARHDLATACVTGEVAVVRRFVERDPDVVNRRLGPSDWTPLLYACYTRLLRADPVRAEGIRSTAGVLLDAGADPNAGWQSGEYLEVALFGAAGIANDPALTRMLLDAGADPNETLDDPKSIGESLYHAIEFPDLDCARMLLEAGTHPNRSSYCLSRALDFPEPERAALLLEYGARPQSSQLRTAVFRSRSPETIAGILDAGAPVDRADRHGLTPLRIATRWGRDDLARLLVERGADPAAVTEEDRALGALVAGRGPAASKPPAELLDWAAHRGDAATVARLLDAGADVRGAADMPALGQATWRGHADVVRVLVDQGAPLVWDDGSAIGAALHGSLHCHEAEAGPTMRTDDEVAHGDYAGVLRILLDAGAPVPKRLWDADVSAEDLIARLGVVWDRPADPA
jgi:ankyrin repeat protein